ncbi:hypothetical protein ACFSKW_46090 [Nonomuraea mangrovi]|uniref:Ricin B lectin domain-containing protein n=1 Tax=Nonomuraea mangrovi TaxID=2316207 RepID=A0ABW4TA88_9ACTN
MKAPALAVLVAAGLLAAVPSGPAAAAPAPGDIITCPLIAKVPVNPDRNVYSGYGHCHDADGDFVGISSGGAGERWLISRGTDGLRLRCYGPYSTGGGSAGQPTVTMWDCKPLG